MGGEYNPMQHVEVREKVGIAGLYVATLQSGARMDSAAADIERMVIAAIHAAAKPLLAEVANLRDQMEATRAAAARERDRMRGNVDAWQARVEAAEQRAEAAEAALAAARAEGAAAERAAIVAEMKTREAAALGRSGAAQDEAREAGCDDWDEAGLADWGTAEALRALAADIAAGAHVRPVEGENSGHGGLLVVRRAVCAAVVAAPPGAVVSCYPARLSMFVAHGIQPILAFARRSATPISTSSSCIKPARATPRVISPVVYSTKPGGQSAKTRAARCIHRRSSGVSACSPTMLALRG